MMIEIINRVRFNKGLLGRIRYGFPYILFSIFLEWAKDRLASEGNKHLEK